MLYNMFNRKTGEIAEPNSRRMSSVEWLYMTINWTPYYNIDGKYIGYRCIGFRGPETIVIEKED